MPIELQAYDGGQEQRLKLGEIETTNWKLDPIEQLGELSSASVEITPASGLSAVQVNLDTTSVSFQLTASTVGKYDVTVTLNEAGGDRRIHRLVMDVFE